MCGGSDDEKSHDIDEDRVASVAYTAPDIRTLYKTFQETGTVPYSYYGAGSPTRRDELELVRKSQPGAFPTPTGPQRPGMGDMGNISPFAALALALLGRR
jgi:hypothetical protein